MLEQIAMTRSVGTILDGCLAIGPKKQRLVPTDTDNLATGTLFALAREERGAETILLVILTALKGREVPV